MVKTKKNDDRGIYNTWKVELINQYAYFSQSGNN